jgi:hypothetical protein
MPMPTSVFLMVRCMKMDTIRGSSMSKDSSKILWAYMDLPVMYAGP